MSAAAEMLGVSPEWLTSRLARGLPISEATTADAVSRLSTLQSRFIAGWSRAIVRMQAQLVAANALAGAAAQAARAQAVSELQVVWERLLDGAWREAFRLGHMVKSGQQPETFPDRFEESIERQKRFASRFAEHIAEGRPFQKGMMGIAARTQLYANALGAAFNHGAVEAAEVDELIFWRLGACDHCTSCPVLAVSGPYTRNTLPTMPRDGVTECRGNCCCFLEFIRRPGRRVNPPPEAEIPFVDRTTRTPPPPPGRRLPTQEESRVLRDMEHRVNTARRRISETTGAEQRRWIQERRLASQRRREFADARSIWDPPKLDVGEVVRGVDVRSADVRELTRARGIDGRTVRRASASDRAGAVAGERTRLAAELERLPATAGLPDLEAMLARAGAPPNPFRLGEQAEEPAPIVFNAVAWGARAVVDNHLTALEVLGESDFDIEVGPVSDGWLDLVLAGGTWIRGGAAEVRRFLDSWQSACSSKPALARWIR